jgi:hypothetical protein
MRDDESEKMILPQLRAIIDATKTGEKTFLINKWGRPFSREWFGNWFKKACVAAGLPKCSAHGLRKVGAQMLADAGATDRQLMAIYDWASAGMATVYTRKRDKRRLSEDAAMMLGRELESGSILMRARDESGPLSERSVAHLQETTSRERVQKKMAGATGLEPAASGVTGHI